MYLTVSNIDNLNFSRFSKLRRLKLSVMGTPEIPELPNMEQLEHLLFDSRTTKNPDFTIWSHLSNLEFLSLGFSNVEEPDSLKVFGKFTKLNTLQLEFSDFEGIEWF